MDKIKVLEHKLDTSLEICAFYIISLRIKIHLEYLFNKIKI